MNQYEKGLDYESLKQTLIELEETLTRTSLSLLIFTANPAADPRWLKKHGRFGAALFDQSGDMPEESEDCEYGSTVRAALNNLIDRWANWTPGQDWPGPTRTGEGEDEVREEDELDKADRIYHHSQD